MKKVIKILHFTALLPYFVVLSMISTIKMYWAYWSTNGQNVRTSPPDRLL